MAWACKASGFVFLVLLQKEHPEIPVQEWGEPEGHNEGGYERSGVGYRASAFLRGQAGWAAGDPFTNPGELFAQRPSFVPRTFLKLFLALSSA